MGSQLAVWPEEEVDRCGHLDQHMEEETQLQHHAVSIGAGKELICDCERHTNVMPVLVGCQKEPQNLRSGCGQGDVSK